MTDYWYKINVTDTEGNTIGKITAKSTVHQYPKLVCFVKDRKLYIKPIEPLKGEVYIDAVQIKDEDIDEIILEGAKISKNLEREKVIFT